MNIAGLKFVVISAGIISLLFFAGPSIANAQGLPSLVPDCANSDGGCNVCDAVQVGINVTNLLLGVLGVAALIMFTYGGMTMLISRGYTEKAHEGREILINATKGVIIVVGSWAAINYGLAVMLGGDPTKPAQIFGKDWAEVQCNASSPQQVPGTDSGPLSQNSCLDVNNNPVAAGTDCGDNSMCDNVGSCVTECQFLYGNLGYKCMNRSSSSSSSSCQASFCPGSDPDYVCCLP